MKKALIATALLSLLAIGCRSDKSEVAPDQSLPATGQQPVASAEIHDAMCGCSIEGIARCGNYIKIGGEFVVLEHPSLGVMEFCRDKKNGARIKVTGSMVDGKYVATTYERVD